MALQQVRAPLDALRANGAFPHGHSPWNPALRVIGQIPPPCVFLLPRGVPTADEPSPRLARLDEVRFIKAMLDLTGVKETERGVHVKRVGIEVYRKDSTQYKTVPMRRVTVYQGDAVLEQKDIKITRGEHIFRDAPRLRDRPSS